MKRHLFSLTVSLLLLATFATASAQPYCTLPELREQAANGWHETYTDALGRTIPVDLAVNVFGQDEAPVLQIAPYAPNPDASLLNDGATLEAREGGVDLCIDHDNPMNYFNPGAAGEKTHYLLERYGERVDPDLVYGAEYGAAYTPREMIDNAVELLTRLSLPADFLFEYPKEFSVKYKIKTDTGELVSPAVYSGRYCRLFHGMPVLDHVGEEYGGNVYSPWFSANLWLSWGPNGRYIVSQSAVREEDVLTEDIPLAPFSDIVNALASQIEAGHIRKVLSLTFGLVLYNDPDPSDPSNRSGLEVDCYYAMPTWAVEALYFDKAKQEDDTWERFSELPEGDRHSAYFRTLFVNAQTGELLDPADKSDRGDGDTRFHGFLSWDDVQ